ncbi:MAG TPA: sialate O-acetylesterase [Prolixibacteraceae bacterium]|nr:sialate O-acetylesterase [Prolixibacteraceae bacterium]HCR89587.1 sialate O-acetylesterase [Prolixibacteraceae bacterium]HCU63022.1 sialate O-acetylesterase [Prolixibacteraceae bacterium]
MNKMNLRLSGVFLFFLLISVFAQAEIKLPAIFGDHMVLQQQTDAAIWGKATAGKAVRVSTSWDNKSYSAQADPQGNWKVKVKTPKAGGPYEITISDGSALKLKDVLIGEVWVCSGQSNMAMTMKGYRNQPITGSNEIIATSANPNIRMINIKLDKSLEPKDDFIGEWKECLPENVVNYSATAYFFGKMIQQVLNVPVGLINSSWGGTRIEPWISENGIKKFNWVSLPDKKKEGEFSPQVPTVLFNAMINPMVGYGLRGAIWYQGESNRNEPDQYRKLMPGLAENWRAEWGIGDFPFYYVQIAPFDYGVGGLSSAYLREAQLKAASEGTNMGMACIMETGEKTCIHPANKKAAGDRLAYLALAKTYGKSGFAYSGPILKEMTVDGSIVKLTFDHANNGLTSYGKELENFEVAGENKRFVSAKAFITGQGITLYSPAVEKPVAVRYAFKDFVVGDLFNIEGLPASSFRTDEWEK